MQSRTLTLVIASAVFVTLADFSQPTAKSRKHLQPGSVAMALEPDSTVVWDDGSPAAVERTMETAARTYAAWTVIAPGGASANADGPIVLVVGADPSRQRTVIRNASTSTIKIGRLSDLNAGVGFLIPPGEDFSPEVQENIYGVAIGTDNAPISLWTERNA